jgi:hypothetical protein
VLAAIACGNPPAPPASFASGLVVLDLDGGQERARLPLGRDLVAVTVDPAGGRAYAADNAAGDVYALDLPALRVRWRLHLGGRPGPLLADGERLWVSQYESARVGEIQAESGQLRSQHGVGAQPGQLAAHAGRVFVACGDGTVWDMDGGRRAAPRGFGLAATAGGTWAADAERAEIVRIEDWRVSGLPPDLHPFWLAEGPPGQVIVAAEGPDEDRDPGGVLVLDERAGTIQRLDSPRDPDMALAYGGRVFVAAHGERSVRVLDFSGNAPVRQWGRGLAAVALAIDEPHRLLVVAANDHE